MIDLDKKDYDLISKAQEAIKSNYDSEEYNHTVGAAVSCKNGNVEA